jgi:hypothetical protein
MRPLVLVLVAMTLASRPCGAAGSKLPTAQWGGEHVILSMEGEEGIRIEFDCAHATLPEAPTLDQDGVFDVEGRYTQEHGGPIRKDEDTSGKVARFQGSLKGDTLTLTIVLDKETKLGPYTLEKGKSGRIFKCR